MIEPDSEAQSLVSKSIPSWIAASSSKILLGNSEENTVRIQIYVAIIIYCLVAIIESVLKLNRDIYEVMRTLVVLYL